ncbi:hypothetical protein Cni_G11454 [Canna indica]|uniref:Uncharacterized protein n=1 Tax=Canna indica TaxID=4628 RepID=A0AAQ3K842_9LILI|nr:hypothetical protein Cni_G11454 [Canna indica]
MIKDDKINAIIDPKEGTENDAADLDGGGDGAPVDTEEGAPEDTEEGRGKRQRLGYVDAKVRTLLEDLAQAAHLLLHHLLQIRAALAFRLRRTLPILHIREAVRQVQQRRGAVHGGSRRSDRRSPRAAHLRTQPQQQQQQHGNPSASHCRQFQAPEASDYEERKRVRIMMKGAGRVLHSLQKATGVGKNQN